MSIPEIGANPHQPLLKQNFPQRKYGSKNVENRSFQAKWFQNWQWLHYDETRDLAFCHTCITAVASKKMRMEGNLELTFISTGYHNWKDATTKKRGFPKHGESKFHKAAVEYTITLPRTTKDVGEQLSSNHAKEKEANRKYLRQVLENVRFLGRQGLALRGDDNEKNSNFMQVLYLRGKDDPAIIRYLGQKTQKLTSHEIQNEMLQILSLQVMREIAKDMNNSAYQFFSVMADEVTDSSNREQVVVCLRWVDNNMEPHEDFIGLHIVERITSDVIVSVLRDTILRMNLNLVNCRGQCYDGASNMSGIRNGVKTVIQREEKRAIYTHCYGHALNLAAGDTVKKQKLLRDTLDTTAEISKLLKYSPRRDTMFEKLKNDMSPDAPNFRTLCPTRWTVKAQSLNSVLKNYSTFIQFWEDAKDAAKDTDTRVRITGIQAQMQQFDYLFGLIVGSCVLGHTDNLSKTLQNPKLTAAEGQNIANRTVQTLQMLRSTNGFDMLWNKVIRHHKEINEQLTKHDSRTQIKEPTLPRRCRPPNRLDDHPETATHPQTVTERYRVIYFEVIDIITTTIKDRFNQEGYQTYRYLEQLLLNAASGQDYEEQIKFVTDFYASDFQEFQLRIHLQLLQQTFSSQNDTVNLQDVVQFYQSLSPAARNDMSQVWRLVALIMVMPATNAVSERCASALKRVKTYLRTTMTQSRLNNLMRLHVHKERTDRTSISTCITEYVSKGERRLTIYGRPLDGEDR